VSCQETRLWRKHCVFCVILDSRNSHCTGACVADAAWDVVIIGAGVAGLAAGADLASKGHSILILEARDRVGGRVWTRHEPEVAAPVELGAEFIHGEIPETFELLQEVGKAALAISGPRYVLREGKLQQRAEGLFAQIQEGLERFVGEKRADVAFESFLAAAERYGLSKDACKLARGAVEGFDAADPARASTLSIAEEWGAGGMLDAPQFRPSSGYSSVLAALSGALERKHVRLQLQTVVQAIQWGPSSVEVDGEFLGKPFHAKARRAIVTLPLGVLQAPADATGGVRFTPALKDKHTALAGLASGPVLKVVLRYRSAFWEELEGGKYHDAGFFQAPDLTFPTFWTARPVRAPLLAAWMGGPRAARLGQRPVAQIVREASDSAQAMFGGHPLELEAAYVHDWLADPFSRGAYSYVTVGGQNARRELAAPIHDTLFFAGEATDSEGGTVTGALHSGTRAAREVHKSLQARSGRS
jgi:monoamine oxidase